MGSQRTLVLISAVLAVPTPCPQFPHLSKGNDNCLQGHRGEQGSGENSVDIWQYPQWEGDFCLRPPCYPRGQICTLWVPREDASQAAGGSLCRKHSSHPPVASFQCDPWSHSSQSLSPQGAVFWRWLRWPQAALRTAKLKLLLFCFKIKQWSHSQGVETPLPSMN